MKPLVRLARSGRPIVALDGCRLRCVASRLARHGVTPDRHVMLADHGVRKTLHSDYDPDEADRLFGEIAQDLARHPPASPRG